MPEADFLALYSYKSEPPKKAPIIKLSCGIGDTDGFPAFDVDSEQYAAKDDSKWGFLITGGAEFHMPLTVFQVTPDGLADKGGICLGDIILEINEEDATQLTLSQAHEKIDASGKKIHFLVKSMEEEEPMEGYEPGEERSIVLRVPKPPPPPKVCAIEKRLQELHRKLSEIAEIPKILSSTLATVSETFDKLTNTSLPVSVAPAISPHYMQKGHELNYHHHQCDAYENEQTRKLSYDEDIYDYELSNEEEVAESDEEEFDAKKAYLQLKRYAARQRKSKDVTPESDYASESNYQRNETKDYNENTDIVWNVTNDSKAVNTTGYDSDDNDVDDDENSCDMYEEFNLPLFNIPLGHINDTGSDTEEFEQDDGDDDDDEKYIQNDEEDNDDDFLTTTFTWNLRNKPKLQINESLDLNHSENYNDNEDNKILEEGSLKANIIQLKSFSEERNFFKSNTPEKEQKLDKLERSWPWADREKIIYKQSTCHLVPNKPLGLIEQRIQLLAKRNLLEHLNKTKNPQ